MINLFGSINRKFEFPADSREAFEFYANLERTLSYLQHISILERFSDTKFRMLYHTSEMGIYHVRIFCDLQAEFNRKDNILRFHPFESNLPIPTTTDMYSLNGKGFYKSQSIFREHDDCASIEYHIELSAELPTPPSLRFIPQQLLNKIAKGIAQWRIEEIVDTFIERSIKDYDPNILSGVR